MSNLALFHCDARMERKDVKKNKAIQALKVMERDKNYLHRDSWGYNKDIQEMDLRYFFPNIHFATLHKQLCSN